MSDKVTITTPEHVELQFELAGLGSRLMAFLIDMLYLIGISIGLSILLYIFNIGISLLPWNLSSWPLAIVIVLNFLLFWGYGIFFEIRWNGQTPGKRNLKLRVIRDTGHPIDAQAAIIRNIIRLPEMMAFAAGFFVLFFSPHSKRLGDYAAGTLVVKVREQEALSIFDSKQKLALTLPEYQLLDDRSLSRMAQLTRQDYETVRRYLDRAGYLDPNRSDELARQIAEPLMDRLGLQRPQLSFRYAYGHLLSEIAQAYERHKGF